MKDAQQKEKGQVLVLIILAIVGIMGFAALAVDIGRLYAERRRAQSAADAAAMAWAYDFSQTDVDNPGVAVTSLTRNGFPDQSVVELYHPPTSGPYTGDMEYFQVIIGGEVAKVFGQFIFLGPMNLRVEAVTHTIGAQGISPGNALVAMGEYVCPGIVFNGGTNTTIRNGSIFSNSNGNGPGACYSGITSGAPSTIDVINGEINIAAGWDNNGGGMVNPAPNSPVGHTNFPDVPVPVCPHEDSDGNVVTPGVVDNSTHTIYPGVFDSPLHVSSGNWTMAPGMYCFEADFHFSGGGLTGTDVMFVMYNGSIKLNGTGEAHLDRPNYIEDATGRNFGGMLIYMPYENTGGIDIAGASGTTYSGTIYAPGPRVPDSQEKCNLGGTNKTMAMNSTVMCHTIGIAGNSVLTINYNERANYRNAPTVELSQ
jgi:hypothetical protein